MIGSRTLNQIDPERQMETVIGYIIGGNTQDSVVQKARFAIDKARSPIQDDNINISRTYTKDELSEMESRLDRLEILVIRKRAGEIISPEEINRVSIRNKKSSKPVPPAPSEAVVAKTKPRVVVNTEEESTTKTIKPDEIIAEIESIIAYAKGLPKLIMDSENLVKDEIEKAKKMIDQTKSDGMDVEEQEKMLFTLIRERSKTL